MLLLAKREIGFHEEIDNRQQFTHRNVNVVRKVLNDCCSLNRKSCNRSEIPLTIELGTKRKQETWRRRQRRKET